MRLVAARDITVADLPYISNPFFAKNDVRDAYCDGFTSIHNLNEFVPAQWRNYQQGLDELLKKIDKMEVCLVYSMKLPFLGVVYWQQDPDYPNNSQKGRWVASLSGINQYANLQGIVSSAYSKIMVPQTHSQQASLQSSTAKAVVNQGFENSVEGGRRNFLGQKQVMARPEEAERGDHVLQEATAFKQTDFASTYSMRLSQTPAETNDVVGTALTAGGLRTGLGLSKGTVVSSAGGRVVPNTELSVRARAKVGDQLFEDINPTLRLGADANQKTFISEFVEAKPLREGGYPNSNMANAHAEIGVAQQIRNSGVGKGSNVVMDVDGLDVCGFCQKDLVQAAIKDEYTSLTVRSLSNKTGLPKTYYWEPGMSKFKIIKSKAE